MPLPPYYLEVVLSGRMVCVIAMMMYREGFFKMLWIITCDDEYIGETSRTFGERFKEHLKEPFPIHHHSNNTGHPTTQHNFQMIGKEGHSSARGIKESIFIRVNNPTLNRNIGKFNLPHLWDTFLLDTPGLNLKRHPQTVGHANSS